MMILQARRVLTRDEAKAMKNTRVTDKPPATLNPDGPTLIVDEETGVPFCLVAKASKPEAEKVRAAAVAHKDYLCGVLRSGGMRSNSSTFGFSAPSHVVRRVAPSASSWAWRQPESHTIMCDFAAHAAELLGTYGPDAPNQALAAAKTNIHPDWRLGDTAWTSGILNDTAPLYYHYDRNNVPGTWSAMISLRAGTRGGHLHIADYDLTLPTRDGDVSFFPGMDLMHGVTPITTTLNGGYRYTAVYYSVKRFLGVPGADEALDAARRRQVELEEGLLDRQRDAGLIT